MSATTFGNCDACFRHVQRYAVVTHYNDSVPASIALNVFNVVISSDHEYIIARATYISITTRSTH